jgi:hypothetical protein
VTERSVALSDEVDGLKNKAVDIAQEQIDLTVG